MRGWVIDRDYINAGEVSDEEGVGRRVGYGQASAEQADTSAASIPPRSYVTAGLKASEVEDPVRFRIKDDDGEVYYGGAISRDWIEGDETLAFAPLAFAAADAGATTLEYRDGDDWRML